MAPLGEASIDVDGVEGGKVGHERVERSACAVGAGPDDGDCGEQRVPPVLLDPTRHFVEQIRLESAVHGEGGEDCVLDAPILLASELDFGQMFRQELSVGDGAFALDAIGAERVGGEFHEYFAGEGVVPYVEVDHVGTELVSVLTLGESAEEPSERLDAVVVGGSAHVDTLRNRPVRQSLNRSSRRAFSRTLPPEEVPFSCSAGGASCLSICAHHPT